MLLYFDFIKTIRKIQVANAFEGVGRNDIEKRNLEKYRSRVAALDAEEAKLKELRAESRDPGTVRGKA